MGSSTGFWMAAVLSPGLLAIGFAESGRRLAGDSPKVVVLMVGLGLFGSLGWISARERWRGWGARVLVIAAAFVVWDVVLSASVYPGFAKDVDWSPTRVLEIWSLALVSIGIVFLLARTAARLSGRSR